MKFPIPSFGENLFTQSDAFIVVDSCGSSCVICLYPTSKPALVLNKKEIVTDAEKFTSLYSSESRLFSIKSRLSLSSSAYPCTRKDWPLL